MNAQQILIKACEYDLAGRRLEALKLYEDGIRQLLQMLKNEPDKTKKKHYEEKFKEYITRAECIKKEIEKYSTKGEVVDRIHIMNGATGYSYKRIFGKYLTNEVKEIEIEEPYLKENFQLSNFVMFLELVVKKCTNLKFVKLTTQPDNRSKSQTEQKACFRSLTEDIEQRGISLCIEYSEVIHDRQIIFSNGYIFKIGRGLDIYKAKKCRYVLGFGDYDFRECKETNVDIFKCKT